MAKNLFVGNLPYSVTDESLTQLFSQYGNLVSANVIKDKYTGRSRGFAFVEMTTEEEAQKAIASLNGYNIEGRNMVVREALPKPAYSGGGGQRSGGGYQGGGGGRGGYGGGSDRRNRRY